MSLIATTIETAKLIMVCLCYVFCFIVLGKLMFDGGIFVGVTMFGSSIFDSFMLNSNMPGNVMSNEVSYTTAYTQKTFVLKESDLICDRRKTRPDTRPPVADGWAGAEMRVSLLFDSCPRTDGRTDGQSLL